MARFSNLLEVENFIFNHLAHYSIEGDSAYRPGLDKTRLLLSHLGDPQKNFKSVHVGGTNGKGSTTHLMASAFMHRGLKVGTYTSPHITTYRERIRVDGVFVEEQFVLDFTNKNWELIQQLDPSFFEFTVALAFSYFRYKKVDIAVVEVGLGGTYDSTNVLEPEIAIITNVGLDHINTLGSSLPEIASNKAGIIKPETPVVIGEYNEETFSVFKTVAEKNSSPLALADEQYTLYSYELTPSIMQIKYLHFGEVVAIQTDLRGSYQIKNIATALTATEMLKEKYPGLRSDLIYSASRVQEYILIMGRWQTVSESPRVILDVCHNAHGVQEAMKQLSREDFGDLYIILGLSSDKDAEEILKLLPDSAHLILTQANTKRAMTLEDLKKSASNVFENFEFSPDLKSALDKAHELAKPEDLILTMGSCYLIGEYFS